jgi:RHS repeat-associated protein
LKNRSKYCHNRLMDATYTGTIAEGISTTMFDATHGYDKNGNIGYLKRTTGGGATVMDELIYSYAANQLTAVADGGDATKGFKDKPNAIVYTYDAAGNMITDANKDLSIAYNHLNLPASITRTNSGTNNGVIKHYYAGATKVRMETYDAAGTTLVKAYDYMAGMVYLTTPLSSGEVPGVRSELDFIASSEGRAILTKKVLNLTTDPTTGLALSEAEGDKFRFEYSLKDHLGNLRVSCRCSEPKRDAQGVIIPEGQPGAGIEQLAVVQEQHYDAWGLSFTSTSSVTADRFTYNSKELVTDLDLGWNDYGFRMYDASVGRWSTVDPLEEKLSEVSPYNYVLNNPLSFIDPDGLYPKPILIFNQATNTYRYTNAASHLLSLVSGVDKRKIQNAIIQPRAIGQYRPFYSSNKGGGAITLGATNYHTITYTENFFEDNASKYEGHGYGQDIYRWLSLSSHEVGHIEQIDREGGFFAYTFEFIKQYGSAGNHDGAEYEKEADIGQKVFGQFNSFIDETYGKNSLTKLFQNNVDPVIVKRLDKWWGEFESYRGKKEERTQSFIEGLSTNLNNYSEGTYIYNGSNWVKKN